MPTCTAYNHLKPCTSSLPDNVKHYNGFRKFNQSQFYDGEFLRDSIHGQGTYKWDNLAVYEGGFYSNYKEGYATVSFVDGSYFEGLFVQNQPFGPGIFTYPSGRQDAGFWVGKKLVRLGRPVDYIIPRLAPTSAAKIKLLQFRRLIPLNQKTPSSATEILKRHGCLQPVSSPYSSFIYDKRSIFFDTAVFEKAYFAMNKVSQKNNINFEDWTNQTPYKDKKEGETPIPPHCQCAQSELKFEFKETEESDICYSDSFEGETEVGILAYFTKNRRYSSSVTEIDEESSKEFEEEENEAKESSIVSWNRSEVCTEILKQIFRYKDFEEKLNFNLAKLMLGARTVFRRTGEKEKQSLHFLKMCSLGPPHVIKDLLCCYENSEELMDSRGNNSVMFAAASDQHEVIDILLDYGVDVNTFNDEGLTPLNLCLLRRLAYTHQVTNWEVAFLPKEIDGAVDDICQADWQTLESIQSLDRIFGDGMSLHDSKRFPFDPQLLSPFPSPVAIKERTETMSQQRVSDESKDSRTVSQITILNLPNSPGSYSLVPQSFRPGTASPLKSGDLSLQMDELNLSKPIGSNQQTPKITVRIVPKTNKREEFSKSVDNSSDNRYLFGFSFEENPSSQKETKIFSGKGSKARTNRSMASEEVVNREEKLTQHSGAIERIEAIDKTIIKLLKRGADPNISEVPKPTIHLGVFTKDLNLVRSLLLYGACPDSQLYLNEGLLTPLHVLALQKPTSEYVSICELLLNFGADPNKETSPEFCMCEKEKEFLSSSQGRTPLQLLCMRPDLQWVDTEGDLIRMALILAKFAKKKQKYNGHSYLTLAMMTGNMKLLEALLSSGYFDPNEILGHERGTTLHVLVSTELQKKTPYENSIQMCDLLVEAGANPLKKFKFPDKLQGTCVDYGRREIDARKFACAAKKDGKSSCGKDKGGSDLTDHERLVDYLGNATGGRKTGGRGSFGKDGSRGADKNRGQENSKKGSRRDDQELGKDGKKKGRVEINEDKKGKKDKKNEKEDKKGGKDDKKSGKDDKGKKNKDGRSSVDGTSKFGTSNMDKRKPGSNQKKGSLKTGSDKMLKDPSEVFPEKLRQSLLRLYGACANIDINEFLVPYVVLRNGELYYRFDGKTTDKKEQYSLI